MIVAFALFVDWLLLSSVSRHWVCDSAAAVCSRLVRTVSDRAIRPATSATSAVHHSSSGFVMDNAILPSASAIAAVGCQIRSCLVAGRSIFIAALADWANSILPQGTWTQVISVASSVAKGSCLAAIAIVFWKLAKFVIKLRREAQTDWPTGSRIATEKLHQLHGSHHASDSALSWTGDDMQYHRDLAWYFSLREALPSPLRAAALRMEAALDNSALPVTGDMQSSTVQQQLSRLLRSLSSAVALIPSLQPPSLRDTFNSLGFVSSSVVIISTVVITSDYMWLNIYRACKSSGGLPAWQAAASHRIWAASSLPRGLAQSAIAAVLMPLWPIAAAGRLALQSCTMVATATWKLPGRAIAPVGPGVRALAARLEVQLCMAVDKQMGIGRGPVAVVALRRAALAGLALIAIALVWRLWRRWHAVSRHLAHLTQEGREASKVGSQQ